MAMIDPSEYGLEDSQEPYAVKPGEYKLKIISVGGGMDKNDLEYLQPRLEVCGEPYSKDFTHFLHVPDKGEMGEKQLNRVKFAYSSFCKCFSIDTTRPFDPKDDWAGCEGWGILGLSESKEYGEQNFIRKLLTPK